MSIESKDLTIQSDGFMAVDNLDQAMKVAELISKSQFCPKQFMGKPGDIIVCLQIGKELGIKPMQSLQNIAVINGRPSLWGDAMLAVCRNSADFEFIDEQVDEVSMKATCIVKRKNEPEVVRTFSKRDAEAAGLWKKQGPWTQFPARMLQMRARSFALRDAFPDALRGIAAREEAQDSINYSRVNQTSSEELVSDDRIQQLMQLASSAEVSIKDICKVANVEKLSDLKESQCTSIWNRLLKKRKQVEDANRISNAINDSQTPEEEVEHEVDTETGEVV